MGSLEERKSLVEQVFKQHDVYHKGHLNANQLQNIHSDMRISSISIPQIKASIGYVCVGEECDQSELFEVLQEMDRRYFLIQDLRWEFTMLDYGRTDTISEGQAKWFVQMVHGSNFLKKKWERFLRSRAVPGSGVSFQEIEVTLCNIPSRQEVLEEEEEERRAAEENLRKRSEFEKLLEEEKEKRRKQREEERRRREEEDRKRMEEEDRRREEEDAERLQRLEVKADEEARRKRLEEEEERGNKEAEERERKQRQKEAEAEERRQHELQEAARLRDLAERAKREEEERKQREEREAKSDETELMKATELEREAESEAEAAKKRIQEATDARSKKEAEEAEKRAQLRARENRNKRIRYNLKVAVKLRDRERLPKAMAEFQSAKLPDDDKDYEKGERIMKEWQARDGLERSMRGRNLKELEGAVNYVKRNGFEITLANEMIEANKILLQLRRLERIRAEILELKQSTVAEIRSYQKPPPIVHTVMTGTFLLLGHKEKETKDWKTVQALVGKTGKEGLKRRCIECVPYKINPEAAKRCKELIGAYDLDDVRDVSAGAATFFVWSLTMTEELEIRLAAIARGEVFDDEETKKKENPAVDNKIKNLNRDKSKSPGRTVIKQQVVTTRTRTKSSERTPQGPSGGRSRSNGRPGAQSVPGAQGARSKSESRPTASK